VANIKLLRTEARKALETKIDPAYREKISELVPTGATVIGVRVPEIQTLAKTFAAAHSPLDFDTASALLDAQFAARCREEVLFGIFVLERIKKQLGPQFWPTVDRWVDAVEDWEVCDQLSKTVAAPIVLKQLSLVADLKKWAKSSNPWRRRFSLATTTALNQKGRAFPKETLEVCEPVLGEREVIVQKAVGWALREACKHDEPAVFEFLRKHRARVHPRILREGSEKLTEAHRRALTE
jgi:3-methyladenine DNA glycosylase AlkD